VAGLALIGELLAVLHSDRFTLHVSKTFEQRTDARALLTDAAPRTPRPPARQKPPDMGLLRRILAGKDGMRG
jgi:hypothetical protein